MPTPWTTRIWQEFRAGSVSRAEKDVLCSLHTFRSTGGTAWPSHATLASRAGTCTRTVGRALAAARDLGLVSWVERRVRAGWRWLRSSNLYRFLAVENGTVPKSAAGQIIQPEEFGRSALPDSRAGEGRVLGRKKAALDEVLREAASLPDLLALRRAAFLHIAAVGRMAR
jgi:hypothetical protein